MIRHKCVRCGEYEWAEASATDWGKNPFLCSSCSWFKPRWSKYAAKDDIWGVRSPLHHPRPEYDRCNAGHALVEIYDEDRDEYIWDCPICKKKMEEARRR